jgi:uncharacterized membrane protein
VTFAHPLPWWAFGIVVASAAAVAWAAYRRFETSKRRRAALASLRFITLLLLVVFLMQPVARTPDDEARDAVVPILVDQSRSMSIQDETEGRRIDRARSVVRDTLLPMLGPRFRVEVLGFGDALAPASAETFGASARRSDLSGALAAVRERYRGRALAGIVLVSDGGDTSGASARSAEAGPPVFPVPIGSRTVGRDREVLSVTAAEAVLDGSRIDLAVSAVSHGHGTAPIELRLLENGRPVEVRRVAPAAEGAPAREVFHVSPGRGAPTVYTVEIPSASGELVPENNRRSVLVEPPSRRRRVLLVQGAPGFEHSFLKRAWAGDSGLEVDSVVRKGQNEEGHDTFYVQAARARGTALAEGYPAKADGLFAYDALVLANVEASQLTRAQLGATREFVARRGGGLLVLGAHSFLRRGLVDTPVEEALPLDLNDRGRGVLPASSVTDARGPHRVSLTRAGEAHPIMQLGATIEETRKRWSAAPALASVVPLGGARPGASVLAATAGPGGSPRALVAVQRFGDGRSMIFTGEAAWRWRMLLPSSDRSYDTFWRQAVRWLALPAMDPVAIVPPAGASAGDSLAITVLVRNAAFEPAADATVDVRVTRPDGRLDELRAAPDAAPDGQARYVGRYRADQAGVYRVSAEVLRDGQPVTVAPSAFLVGGADLEMTDPRVNLLVLQRVALASGGRVIAPGDASDLVDDLLANVPAATLMVRRDLWHTGWSFIAILALLAAEWVLRRRWGLR